MADKIIIISGKQYSGKDTAAKYMLEKLPTYKRIAIGDIIKTAYGKKHGLTYDEIEQNKPKYRADLIMLGHWGRAMAPDYWIKKILEEEGNIIVTDVRLPNEYEIFKSAGAISIRIEASRETRAQRGTLVCERDITETGLDEIKDWNYIVENNRELNVFKARMMDIAVKIRKGKIKKPRTEFKFPQYQPKTFHDIVRFNSYKYFIIQEKTHPITTHIQSIIESRIPCNDEIIYNHYSKILYINEVPHKIASITNYEALDFSIYKFETDNGQISYVFATREKRNYIKIFFKNDTINNYKLKIINITLNLVITAICAIIIYSVYYWVRYKLDLWT